MKLHIASAPLLVVLLANASSIRADGFIQKLPDNGTWARYFMTLTEKHPGDFEIVGTLTVRSVGRETAEGIDCRWIEFDVEGSIDGRNLWHRYKVLAPEEDFAEEKRSAVRIIRGWQQDNFDEKPERITAGDSSQHFNLMHQLCRPMKGRNVVSEPRKLDFQKGTLECRSGISGELEKSETNTRQRFVFTIWPHEKAPFGSARAEYKTLLDEKGKTILQMHDTFILADFGTGAKSAMPECR